MTFASLTFLIAFLPLTVLFYFLMPTLNLRNWVLFFSSLLFYVWGEPKVFFLLAFSIMVNYFSALLIDKMQRKNNQLMCKLVFLFIVLFDLFPLFFYKYANFTIFNLNRIMNTDLPFFNVVLPIGISFYTFQMMSYVIDVFTKKVSVQKNLMKLATYIMLFPQLVAGPIVRYSTIEEELSSRESTADGIESGCRKLSQGIAKKMILANPMALIADTIYALPNEELSTALLWIAAFSYAFQIYYDFSGYSDMAIGMGEIFGFHFDINFNYPYQSLSVKEFWRRWHISLGTWFKDYVYIPLGGSRVSTPRWIFNLFVVWGLTGLWHGASWNYILWGLYYAVLLIVERYTIQKISNKPFRWVITMFLVLIGWVIFRIEGLSTLKSILVMMFSFSGNGVLTELSRFPELFFSYSIFIPAIYFAVPHNKLDAKIPLQVKNVFSFIIYGISLIMIVNSSYNPFVYFRF